MFCSAVRRFQVERRRVEDRHVHQIFGHVEADAAGADDRHPRAGHDAAAQHVQITDDLGVIDPRKLDLARADAGGQHHFVEVLHRIGIDRRRQPQLDAGVGDAVAEIAQVSWNSSLPGICLAG